jgi:hypothetical protein
MEILIYVFAANIAIAAVLANLAIWAPRPTWVRFSALIVTAVFVPIVYLGVAELLSKPKPMNLEWYDRDAEQAAILGVSFHEGEAIYLWLRVDNAMEPRYYVLPWRQQLAERLEDAIENAINRNATAVLRMPFFRRSFDELGHLNLDVILPPVPPQKTPPVPPRVFNPRPRDT